jgi:branched-chain amino acid transport system substrate-binding protein
VQAITQLLTKNPLVATSSECSGDNLAMKPKISAAGVPMVVDSLSPSVVDGADTMWQVTSTVEPIGAGLDRYMASHGVTTVAVIHDASAYGVAAAKGVSDAASQSKLSVVKDVTYQLTDTDYSAGILAVKAANPSAVYVEGYAVQQAQVITQMKQLGLTVPIYASMDIDDPAAFKAGGSALNGVVFASSWIANDSAASKEFVENYTKVAQTAPAVVAETAYESALVILDALQHVSGDLTPKAVNDAIGATSMDLPTGPATFGTDRVRQGANIYIGEVEDSAVKSLGTA